VEGNEDMKRPGNPVEGDNSHIIRDSTQKIAYMVNHTFPQ
jgi:hypothetical protein